MENMVNQKFWKDKKVLVTGHTGFKGSWLSLWLQQLGAEVVGYSLNPPTKTNLFELADVASGMKSIIGDVRDTEKLKGVFKEEKPEIVIHLAGQPIVRLSYEDPVLTYTTNVIGTVNVLDAVRNTLSVKSVVCITSDKCYENKSWEWGYRETDQLGGKDPYSSSKACAELVIRAYQDSYFSGSENVQASVASARAGNVIGGGDWAKDRLIPDIVRSFSNGKAVLIRNPKATRPWQHVLEPLCGYLILAEKLYLHRDKFVGAWNFGPDIKDVKPVSYIADCLYKNWGDCASWKTDKDSHPHESMLLALDNSKAKRYLKWQPKLSLEETLDWIVEWHKTLENNKDVRKFSIKQIDKYQNIN